MNKSFKGKLASAGVARIRLSTNNGLTGYKIKAFNIIDETPGVNNTENVAKVYSNPPLDATGEIKAGDGVVNFDNPQLIAVAFYKPQYGPAEVIIVDTKIVNQDIYVTAFDVSGNSIATNYLLELEQVKLDVNEATVATLKDMRGRE